MITEKQVINKCKKHNLTIGKITNLGSWTDTRLTIICSECGEHIDIAYSGLQRRKTSLCAKCLINNQKTSIDELKNRIEQYNCKLLSTEYKNFKSKLKIQCSCGNTFTKIANDILKTKKLQCKKCLGWIDKSDIDKILNKKFEFVSRKSIKFKCSCGEDVNTTGQILIKSKYPGLCQKCINLQNRKKSKLNTEKRYTETFECFGCQVLGEYQPTQKVKIKCKCGNIFYRRFDTAQHYDKYLCNKCLGIETEIEKIIRNLLEENNIKFIQNDRQKISPLEIDFLIPKYNLGIECNGLYWHSELAGRDKFYHENKRLLCVKEGINLIQFWESEIINKTDIVKSMILTRLGIADKIYARKTQVYKPDKKEYRKFFDDNHLQGNFNSQHVYGLKFNNEPVLMFSLSKSRYNKNYDYEIIRIASKLNTIVVGGISKLYKFIIQDLKPDSIITYADKRYSRGDIYKTIGFKYIQESKPNYHYFKNRNLELESRNKYQKHLLKQKIEKYDESLTEWENMQNNDYNRVWDCGNFVYGVYL